MQHTDPAVANLERMQAIARYDLFHPELLAALQAVCRRTADRLQVSLVAVQAVLDTATAVLATNGGTGDYLSPLGGAPNELSLCPNVVATRAPYVIDDLGADPVHADNPGVRMGLIGAYAGIPLTLPTGEVIGTYCAMHPGQRPFTADDLEELTAAGTEALALIRRYETARQR